MKNLVILMFITVGIVFSINNGNCANNNYQYNIDNNLSKQSYKHAKIPNDFSKIIKQEENKNIIVNLFQNTNNKNNNTSIHKNIDDVIDDINISYDNEVDFNGMDDFV